MVLRRQCTGFLLTNSSSPQSFSPSLISVFPSPPCLFQLLSQLLLSFLTLSKYFHFIAAVFSSLPFSPNFLSALSRPAARSSIYVLFKKIYTFLQPYLLKYLLTLFPFHKVTAIYTPIHVKAVKVNGGMWSEVGLGVRDEPSMIRFTSPPPTSHPTYERFKVQFHLEPVQ